jgi:hypothetical protein
MFADMRTGVKTDAVPRVEIKYEPWQHDELLLGWLTILLITLIAV